MLAAKLRPSTMNSQRRNQTHKPAFVKGAGCGPRGGHHKALEMVCEGVTRSGSMKTTLSRSPLPRLSVASLKTLMSWMCAAGLLAGAAVAQAQDFSKVQIKITKVAGSVYMLEGSGGNIGVCAGEDGIVLVDDQFAPLAPKIR